MSFTPQFLDELRTRISLASIVGRRVRLTRRGRDYVGLCPFHKEKSPSFNVVEDKGFYHCFGCGAHGDVIGFKMRTENLEFRETVEELAKLAGLRIPAESQQERERAARAHTLYDACEAACAWFEQQLRLPTSSTAMAYLRSRGLKDETITHFRLGYAPNSRKALKQALGTKFPESLLVECGLLRRNEEDGETFDFFRNRAIFPICDRSGRVIGFGGRILGDGQPKYLNSPETPIFQKGRGLFGFHHARKAVTRDNPVIVTEGYLDVISLHQAGFTTAVAPLGTALTEQQLSELWKISDTPIICLDGDAAGRAASHKAIETALPVITANKSLRFAFLPDKEDPDTFVSSRGADGMRQILDSAQPLSEALWLFETRGKPLNSAERIAEIRNRMDTIVATVNDKNVSFSLKQTYRSKLWEELSSRRTKNKNVGQVLLPSAKYLDASLSKEETRRRLSYMLVAIAIKHPSIVSVNIDSFDTIGSHNGRIHNLCKAIENIVASAEDFTDLDLEQALIDDGFGEELSLIFNSNIHLATNSLRPDTTDAAALVEWSATFSSFILPELEKELSDRVQTFLQSETEEALRDMEHWRQEVFRERTQIDYDKRYEELKEAGLLWTPRVKKHAA